MGYVVTLTEKQRGGYLVLNIIQFFLSFGVFIGLSLLIVAVLRSPFTRSQPYNIYLVSLQLVDLIMNFMLMLVFLYYFIKVRKDQIPEGFQVLFIVRNAIVIFSTFVNMFFLSALVAHHIYKLLKNSYRASRVQLTMKRVIIESLVIYLHGIGLAIMNVWSTIYVINHHHHDENGSRKYDMAWGIGLCCGLLIPMSIIAYATVRIWKQKLLPICDSRTRTVTIYFARIVFVFVMFYIPAGILFGLGVSIYDDVRWLTITATILYSLQGAFSMAVSLSKPDIKEAFIGLLRCGWNNMNNTDDNRADLDRHDEDDEDHEIDKQADQYLHQTENDNISEGFPPPEEEEASSSSTLPPQTMTSSNNIMQHPSKRISDDSRIYYSSDFQEQFTSSRSPPSRRSISPQRGLDKDTV